MAYLTEAQVEARVGGADNWRQLTDDNGNGQPDPVVTASLLGSVDEEANGYFRAGGYTVPLSSPLVEPVRNALLDIANYRAKTRGDRRATEADRLRYEDAMRLMEKIAKRDFLLTTTASITLVGEYVVDSAEEIFSRTTLRGY